MNEVLSMIVAVQILCDDLHYRSKGNCFYALHLLADRVKAGLDQDLDALREAYYLGEKNVEPPCTCEILRVGISKVDAIRQNIVCDGVDMNKCLILRLRDAVHNLFCYIETVKEAAKDSGMTSGTISILDGISAKMLTANALLDRSGLAA